MATSAAPTAFTMNDRASFEIETPAPKNTPEPNRKAPHRRTHPNPTGKLRI